jgi:hypothetical protein
MSSVVQIFILSAFITPVFLLFQVRKPKMLLSIACTGLYENIESWKKTNKSTITLDRRQ